MIDSLFFSNDLDNFTYNIYMYNHFNTYFVGIHKSDTLEPGIEEEFTTHGTLAGLCQHFADAREMPDGSS